MAPQKMTARNKKTGQVINFMWDNPQPPTEADLRRIRFREANKAVEEKSLWQRAQEPLVDWATKAGGWIADKAEGLRKSGENASFRPGLEIPGSGFGLGSQLMMEKDRPELGPARLTPEQNAVRRAQMLGFTEGAAPAAGETIDSFTSPVNLGLMAVSGGASAAGKSAMGAAKAGKTFEQFNRARQMATGLSRVEQVAGLGFGAQGGREIYEGATAEGGPDWRRIAGGTAQLAGGGAMAGHGGARITAAREMPPPLPTPAPVPGPVAPPAPAPAAAAPTGKTPKVPKGAPAQAAPAAAAPAAPTGLPKRTIAGLKKLGYADPDIAALDLKAANDILANGTAKAAPPTPVQPDIYKRLTNEQLKPLADIDPQAKAELESRAVATAPTGDAPQAPTEIPPVEAPTPMAAPPVPEPVAPPVVEDPMVTAKAKFEAEAARIKAAQEKFFESQRARTAQEPPPPVEPPAPVEAPVEPAAAAPPTVPQQKGVNWDAALARLQEDMPAATMEELQSMVADSVKEGHSLQDALEFSTGADPAIARMWTEGATPEAPPVEAGPPPVAPPVPEPPKPVVPETPGAVADPLAELQALAAQQPQGPPAPKAKPGRKAKPKPAPEMVQKFREAMDSQDSNPEALSQMEDMARNYAQAHGMQYEDALADLASRAVEAPKPKAVKPKGNGSELPPALQRVNWIKVLDKVRQNSPEMKANDVMEQARALHAQGATPEQIITMAVKEDPSGYLLDRGEVPASTVPDVAPPVEAAPAKPRLVKKGEGALIKEGATETLTPEEIAKLKAEMEGPGEVASPTPPPKAVAPVAEAKPKTALGKPQKPKTQQDFWNHKLDEAEADVRAWKAEISGKRADPFFDKEGAVMQLREAERVRDKVRADRTAFIEEEGRKAMERRRAGGQSGSAVNPLGMVKELAEGVRDKVRGESTRDRIARQLEEEERARGPRIELVDRDAETTKMNASGREKGGGTSEEAESRARGMAARGEEYGIVERDGRFRRLLTQEDADSARLKPGQTKIVRKANGSYEMLDGDGAGLSAFESLEKRRQGGEAGRISLDMFRRQEPKAPELDAETADALKDVPSFEDIEVPDVKPKGPKPPKPKNPVKASATYKEFQDVHADFVRKRRASSVRAELAARQFKNLDAAGSKAILGYGRGIRTGALGKVEDFFNSMHKKLTDAGVRVGFREDYLPQMWEHPTDELAATSRRLGLKPRFAMKRIIENYEQGLQLGWKPKMKTISDLVRYYAKTAEQQLANTEYWNWLRDKKVILPSDKAPAGWKEVQGFPTNKITLKDKAGKKTGDVVVKSWKASPEYAKIINRYFASPEEHIHQFANVGQMTKNWALSSGIPFTGINAHGFHMILRNAKGAEGVIKGGLKAANWLLRPNEGAKWMEANIERAPWAVDKGLTGIVENTGEHNLSKNILSDMIGEKEVPSFGEAKGVWGKTKYAARAGAEGLMKVHDVAFEKPLFEKVIPALKLKHFYALTDQLVEGGMEREAAGKLAAKATNELYGGIDWEAMGRNRTFQDLMRGTVLAADWAETNVRLGARVGKAIRHPIKTAKNIEDLPTRNVIKGLLGVYASANVLNYMTSGHFMWDNDSGHSFDIELGSTDVDGKKKKRWIRPFGTGADYARLAVDVAAGIRKGDLGSASNIIKNRLAFAPRAVGDLVWNQDKQGRKIFGKDAYGRPISRAKQAAGAAGELTDVFMPQYAGSVLDLLSGRSNLEMALLRGVEMPVRYSSEPSANLPTGRSRSTRNSRRR